MERNDKSETNTTTWDQNMAPTSIRIVVNSIVWLGASSMAFVVSMRLLLGIIRINNKLDSRVFLIIIVIVFVGVLYYYYSILGSSVLQIFSIFNFIIASVCGLLTILTVGLFISASLDINQIGWVDNGLVEMSRYYWTPDECIQLRKVACARAGVVGLTIEEGRLLVAAVDPVSIDVAVKQIVSNRAQVLAQLKAETNWFDGLLSNVTFKRISSGGSLFVLAVSVVQAGIFVYTMFINTRTSMLGAATKELGQYADSNQRIVSNVDASISQTDIAVASTVRLAEIVNQHAGVLGVVKNQVESIVTTVNVYLVPIISLLIDVGEALGTSNVSLAQNDLDKIHTILETSNNAVPRLDGTAVTNQPAPDRFPGIGQRLGSRNDGGSSNSTDTGL